jgi:hypothetical protein
MGDCLDNVGASTSQQPFGPPRPIAGTVEYDGSNALRMMAISERCYLSYFNVKGEQGNKSEKESRCDIQIKEK